MEVVVLILIFVLCLAIQSFFFQRFAFTKLDYTCRFSVAEAHEGDNIYLIETIYNKKMLPLPWLKVDIHSSRWLDYAGTCSVIHQESRRVTSSFVLRGYQKTTRTWKMKCLKRGIFTTENVTLVSGDLLNLVTTSIPVNVNAKLVVYPEVIDLLNVFKPVNYLQSDNIVKRWIIDDPFIIAGVRDYAQGEPLNRVHWPATAKEGRLMVRKNDFTSQLNVTVLLNIQSKLYEYSDVVNKNIAELGIKVAATVLDEAMKEGAPVSLGSNACIQDNMSQMIFTGAAADSSHMRSLFQILSSMQLRNIKDFEVFLDMHIPDMENGSIIMITAYLSKNMCDQIRTLQQQGNHVTVLLMDSVYEDGAIPEDIDIFMLSEVSSKELIEEKVYI